MNHLIQRLIEQATTQEAYYPAGCNGYPEYRSEFDKEKFAELIVRECAEVIEKRAPGQMGTKGEGWTNGYDDGLMTGAFIIKRHFGVES